MAASRVVLSALPMPTITLPTFYLQGICQQLVSWAAQSGPIFGILQISDAKWALFPHNTMKTCKNKSNDSNSLNFGSGRRPCHSIPLPHTRCACFFRIIPPVSTGNSLICMHLLNRCKVTVVWLTMHGNCFRLHC